MTGNKKFKTQLNDKRDAFLFYIVCMPHLDSNIPSNICDVSIGSEISSFARTTQVINTFVALASRFLNRIQKQGSKQGAIIFMFNKISGKHFTAFNDFADAAANFIKFFSLL